MKRGNRNQPGGKTCNVASAENRLFVRMIQNDTDGKAFFRLLQSLLKQKETGTYQKHLSLLHGKLISLFLIHFIL